MNRQYIAKLPATMTIRVKDYILPARIGLYDFEKEATQRIKVSVNLVLESKFLGEISELKHSVDYTKVRDVIKDLAQSKHTELCEVLASEIASECIVMDGVTQVEVTLDKLEIVEDSDVGVHLVVTRSDGSLT